MRKQLATVFIGLSALVACSNGATESSGYVVVGRYTASILTTTSGGVATDQLAAGAAVTLELAANGTTTGRLVAPASGGEPAMDADLSGTWSQSGDIVTFHQSADTFVRDMPFSVRDQQLVGDETFGGVRVQITLVRP